ncbi:hypothetical protein P4H61_23370 [Paenibacillus peoriae]|uniref:hypothetical protein n=1 Tax=Paenibacillus peoriae TaxID=59893 RepID=UPI00026C641A|nr:hypothetical protein [Paenibacillus peoriae]MEC0184428.1 hypothetical protein [Paenibacillus peoriae]
MEKIIIEPNIGIGTIKIGMSKAEVENCLQAYTDKFNKSLQDDDYFHYAFKVEYDSDGRVNFIEAASHIKDDFHCLMNGIDVFNTKAEELIKIVDELSPYDRQHPELGWMYSFPKLGLKFWRSSIFNEKDTLEDRFKEMPPENQEEELRFQFFETVSISS